MERILANSYRKLDVLLQKFNPESPNILNLTMEVVDLLQDALGEVRWLVREVGFRDEQCEIDFFKRTKPQLLGKLMFYNTVFRIESAGPMSGDDFKRMYFSKHLRNLKKLHRDNLKGEEFYRYYRSARTDLDNVYYKRGNIDLRRGMESYVFEIDVEFSTYYDFKVARIVANDLLYVYISSRLASLKTCRSKPKGAFGAIKWTDSASGLIELVYAFHAAHVLSNGQVSIQQISRMLQQHFNFTLQDIHHAFHRMKTRSGSRTQFLDRLKQALEEYMDKNL